MYREYIQVTPTFEGTTEADIPSVLSSLHKLSPPSDDRSLITRLNPLSSAPNLRFEFLAICGGPDDPVRFYYGATEHLNTLETRLRSIFPPTFDIDRTVIDPARILIHPQEFTPSEFLGAVRRGDVLTGYDKHDDEFTLVESLQSSSSPIPSSAGISRSAKTTITVDDTTVSVASPHVLDETSSIKEIDIPTCTPRNSVIARPAFDRVHSLGIRWMGKGLRKNDWMTQLVPYTESKTQSQTDGMNAPLSTLIDLLARSDVPIAFQAVFQPRESWYADGELRKEKLTQGRDTLVQDIIGSLFELETQSTDGQRQLSKDAEERIEQITQKNPRQTYTTALRAVAVPPQDKPTKSVESLLESLRSVFDPLDGQFYQLSGTRFCETGSIVSSRDKQTRDGLHNLLNRSILSDTGKTRSDLVLSADELANFVVVPSADDLSVEGTRGTRAEQRSRNPLPRPHHDLMRELRDGMSIGYALDESGDPEEVPTAIPPGVLPTHYGRFGTTGSGKSKALINDILSLYENTSGPIILIDPKGDGMTQNYMATHASRFGMDDLEENVLHFPVPEVLPGFSFFDVESAVANGRPREHAVQRKADHYEEILKLVMGTDRYERATVAPTVIKALIKILFDETHGRENGRYRESADYFAHEQLEHLVDQLLEAGPPNPDLDEIPQSSDQEVARTLRRQLQLDPSTFAAVMGGISNRLAYISQDKNLREIFNNLEKQFDFRDFLEEQKVILFNLGDLRDEAARILTGVILTNLNDSLKDAGQLTTTSENPHVVNLLVDEASSIVVSDIMNDLLEKGRGFGLSVGLSMQFPEQIEAEGGRKLYLNALNNIGSTLVSKINVDRELAQAMAHEEMDPGEFTNRIRSLPRGEWIASLPSPTFGQTGPYPFSVQPLPIPPGHPESDRPLTHQEKETFTTVLGTIHTRTEEEFGVVDQDLSADTTVPTALNDVLRVDIPDLDVAIAEVVRNLQLQNQVRKANGWIAVENVDTEIRRLYNEVDSDPPSYSELSNVRHRSRLLEVTIDAESDSLRIRLTDAGEETALPNTGDVQSAGSQAHDDALLQIEAALSTIDCTVNILPQDGSEMPDARATHPDIDHTFAIEAETTTPDNPAKVLKNLQKAQKAGEILLFVVLPGDSETDWAKRVEGILSPPCRKLRDGTIQYYTTGSAVTFNGGATEDGGVTAVRPRTESGSSQNRWQRDGDHLVLVDTDGTEYVRVSSITDLTKDRVPAIYSYDQLANEYIVDEFGQRHTYETKSEFEADWLRIKRPFIPEEELVDVDIDPDTYRIIILRDEDDAVVYKDGSLQPLSTFLDDHLRPALSASMEFSDPSTSTSDTQEESSENIDEGSVSEDKPPSFESFIHEYVEVDPDEQIPKDRAFERYLNWAEMHGVDDPLNKSWFTRKLKKHIDFESTRLRVEGDLVRHYTGIRVLPVTTEDY